MTGELSGIDALFEDGEVVKFKAEDFDKCEDQNMQLLIQIFYDLDEKLATLRKMML